MTKEQLKQYIPLKRELKRLEESIQDLDETDIPAVKGVVTGSMTEFPYLQRRITVDVPDPDAAKTISNRRRLKIARKLQVEQQMGEIEQFIDNIEDCTDREIFELYFLEGKKQKEVAKITGYTPSRISQKITHYLQLS